jgi:hypothetical protein
LRYGGRPAATLRALRAFLFAVPLNCISIGYGMLAMRKVVVGLGLLEGLPPLPGDERLWALLPILAVVLIYTAASGLWGVVATDFLQYILAMAGAFLVMGFALHEVGGSASHVDGRRQGRSKLDLLYTATPRCRCHLPRVRVHPVVAFRKLGGGMLVQRLSTANEREASRAATRSTSSPHVRTCPAIVASRRHHPANLDDPSLAYAADGAPPPTGRPRPRLRELLAAFMSTVSTQVNWGASYLMRSLRTPWGRMNRRAPSGPRR